MDYISITPDQREQMLEAIGVKSIDELFAALPPESRFDAELDLPPAASELALQRRLADLATSNTGVNDLPSFLGAGAYDHFYPSFIDQLILRGEFLTAYTPYQAEASQGSLQAFFEFQTQIARLTGLDIANASLYEGASAVAEAVTLAVNVTGKRRVLVASTLHPDERWVLATHLQDLPVEMVTLPAGENGLISPAVVQEHADHDTACIVVKSPNVFGLIEDWSALFSTFQNAAATKGVRPLNIAVFNPTACALLKPPGACGADLAAGEGQPLGIPVQFGGPYLGLFAARQEYLRKLPGRLVGQTADAAGRRAFCLILQTREQHIRGAKATSNVCTNQGLLALRATMYMSAMGPAGLRTVAEQCWHKAHWLAARIAELDGYSLRYDSDFFHEFVVRCPKPARDIVAACRNRGVLAGVDLSHERVSRIGAENELLIAVTEKRTRDEMEDLLTALREAAK
ncbi:MAG: aminomethyl-transferring glycine dehydrogenase subunit GcvPA [Planctomycetota bacterium]|nr:aminomethyl-transferring glycine dehydrogenase subunit GcvPA [Planctomycetota bacterium]